MLMAASYGGNYLVVQILLDDGADVNAQGGQCGNALRAASLFHYNEIERLLLERGAQR